MTQETKDTGFQYSIQILEQLKLFSVTWQKATTPIRQGWRLSHCENRSAFKKSPKAKNVHKAKRGQKAMLVSSLTLASKNILFWSFWKWTWKFTFQDYCAKEWGLQESVCLGEQLLQSSDSHKSWRSQEVP